MGESLWFPLLGLSRSQVPENQEHLATCEGSAPRPLPPSPLMLGQEGERKGGQGMAERLVIFRGTGLHVLLLAVSRNVY